MRLPILILALLPLSAHAWHDRVVPEATLARVSGTAASSDLLTDLLAGLGGGLALQRIELVRERSGATRLSMLQLQLNLGPVSSASAVMSASCANGACQARLEASTRN